MNENFVEVERVTVNMPTKCFAYTIGEYIDGKRIKKIWLASPGDFMCIKLVVETKDGDRDFGQFIRLDRIESIKVQYA